MDESGSMYATSFLDSAAELTTVPSQSTTRLPTSSSVRVTLLGISSRERSEGEITVRLVTASVRSLSVRL
jgi:hypothetical protein